MLILSSKLASALARSIVPPCRARIDVMGMLARIDLVREMLGQQEILARVDRMEMLGGWASGA